ncbi:MAG: hypothetical protein LDL30_13040 [Desulfovibrio sp.]|nr:hypothetical protein [Desulfovibrio sp.]MCA1986754.1 hypothetical protein [Desulfovibrio sp.]
MSADASSPFHQALCQAMDLCAKAVEFYAQAAQACTDNSIRQVFTRIGDIKTARLKKFDAMLAALATKDAPAACQLDETNLAGNDAVFSGATAGLPKTCPPSAMAAIDAGLALELELKAFYERRLAQAQFAEETGLWQRLVQESNGHYIMLNDLQQYYDDIAS